MTKHAHSGEPTEIAPAFPATWNHVNGKPFDAPLPDGKPVDVPEEWKLPPEMRSIPFGQTHRVPLARLRVHPKNAEIYGEEDVTTLQQSIAESGWIRPLTVTPEYVIISGHRRYLAAKELGYTDIPVEIEHFSSQEAMLERLLRENENRGKTPEQQIREGMTWEPIEKIRARERQGARNDPTSGKIFPEVERVRDIIARRVGLGSGKTYEKGKEVVEAIDKELSFGDILHYGEILRTTLNEQSITAAWNTLDKIVKAREKAEQDRLRKEEEERRKQEEARERYLEAVKKAEHCTLYHCSVADLSHYVQPNCIDCIITDPPYPREYLSVYGDLAQFAAHALKPGGIMAVMVGQSYLEEVLRLLNSADGVEYRWACAYFTPGPAPQLHHREIQSMWKPILLYSKGEITKGRYIIDVFRSELSETKTAKEEKRWHEWGQSERGIADIMQRITDENDLVCDPFVGGGSAARAAMEMKRRFVGCDINEAYVRSLEEMKSSLVAQHRVEDVKV